MERRGNIPLLPNVNQFAEEMKKNRLVAVGGGGVRKREKHEGRNHFLTDQEGL